MRRARAPRPAAEHLRRQAARADVLLRSKAGIVRAGSVAMLSCDAESFDGVAFVVDLDEHRGLVAHDRGVVTGRDVDDGWGGEVHAQPSAYSKWSAAAGEEADVRVAAELGADEGRRSSTIACRPGSGR